MSTYRIKNWGKTFENNRSKTVAKLSWVPIPNGHDSEGFAIIMSHKDGAEIFAAWILILQVASRCPERGLLVRDGGKPYDSASMSMRTRANPKWFDRAWPVLLEVGWIEDVAPACQATDTRLPPACHPTDEERKKEQNRKEEKTAEVERESAAFVKFWDSYPRKEGKGTAEEAWSKHKCTPLLDSIITTVGRYKLTTQWKDPKYIPLPATWLNQRRWEDEPLLSGSSVNTFQLTGPGPKTWNPADDAEDEQ